MRPRDAVAARDGLRDTCDLAARHRIAGAYPWETRTLLADPTLAEPALIFVSREMCELLVDVADSIPDDVQALDLPLPATTGLALFAEVISGIDAHTNAPMFVRGLLWGPIRVPLGLGIGIGSFLAPTDLPPEMLAMVAEYGENPFWLPLGRSEWVFGEPLGSYWERDIDKYHVPTAAHPDMIAASAIEDRRLLAALAHLIVSESVADVGTYEPHSKGARRRRHRAGQRIDRVSVVNMRRRATAPAGESSGESAHYSHRFWVRPYFRWQAYGPNRSRRRLQLVEGHLKGPDDKPFIRKDRVWKLGP